MNGSVMRRSAILWVSLSALGCGTATGVCVGGCYPATCEDELVCDACDGQCVPLPPLQFDGPVLLWMGPEVEAPPTCPARAPVPVYDGLAGLNDSNQCPACACSEPACVFPSGLTASDQTCVQGAGGTETIFPAPASWSGACTAPGMVTANQLASITLAPVTERPCEPFPAEVPQSFDPTWGIFARACRGHVSDGHCADPGTRCEPSAEPPPPGFRQCILWEGDGEPICPETYPEMHTFYGGLEDTRECTPCECTQTAASDCIALLSTYQDDSCTALLIASMMDLSAVDACNDIAMQSAGLGSMDATWIANEPGTCVASGGVAQGEAMPLNPKTFCCQPLP